MAFNTAVGTQQQRAAESAGLVVRVRGDAEQSQQSLTSM
jgi:hypothetical protein